MKHGRRPAGFEVPKSADLRRSGCDYGAQIRPSTSTSFLTKPSSNDQSAIGWRFSTVSGSFPVRTEADAGREVGVDAGELRDVLAQLLVVRERVLVRGVDDIHDPLVVLGVRLDVGAQRVPDARDHGVVGEVLERVRQRDEAFLFAAERAERLTGDERVDRSARESGRLVRNGHLHEVHGAWGRRRRP